MLSLIRTTRLNDIIYTHQRLAHDLSELRFTILPRLQRVERKLLSSKRGHFFAELDVAIRLHVSRGREMAAAIENGRRAAIAPLTRGKAGGLARASTAWRYFDGTFMAESRKGSSVS